jgi:hypothetical protein
MKSIPRLGGLVLAALILGACAGAPARRAPEWTLTTPQPDGTFTWFVGYASSPGGDQVAATEAAVSSLVGEIMKYLGVSISSESTATARATLDSYAAEVRTQVTSRSAGRLAGFTVKDKYIWKNPKTGQVLVYVLASYASSDLEREKRRIAAVFQEKEDAVAKPAAEGRALLAEGRAWEALQRFVEAALAASSSDIDNAGIKVAANLDDARDALASLRIEALGTGYRAVVGKAFPAPFEARLVAGPASRPVAGAPLLVSWQRRSGSRLVSKTEAASTGLDGLMSFTPPPPDFVGKAGLVVRLDAASVATLLDKLPAAYRVDAAALAEGLAQKSLEIPYEVVSAALGIATALGIVDLDDSGQGLPGFVTQAGLSEALARAGFTLPPLALDAGLLAGASEEGILAQARAALGGRAGRLILGKARIATVRREGSAFLAQARAELRVLDLATGSLIVASTAEALGMGPDEAGARSAALRELGSKALAADLLSRLP